MLKYCETYEEIQRKLYNQKLSYYYPNFKNKILLLQLMCCSPLTICSYLLATVHLKGLGSGVLQLCNIILMFC